MFTIKLQEHNGHEQIHAATEVWTETIPSKPGDQRYIVHARKADGNVLHFQDYGVVWVMNEAGSTVAKYWLGYGDGGTDHAGSASSESIKAAA